LVGRSGTLRPNGKNGTVLPKMPVSEFKNRLSFGEYTTSSIKETVGKQVFVQL